MIENGRLIVTADEVAEFAAIAKVQPVAPHSWWMNTNTGQTTVTRSIEPLAAENGDILLMTGPDPDWVEQWAGDWQRACDEQLNPLLDQIPANPGGGQ
ncbi:hypothetical protein ACT89R_01605 [Rhodococcus qingshengii]